MRLQSLAVGTGKRGEVVADNRGGRAWHSGEKRGGGSQLPLAGNPSGSEAVAVTHNPDSQ